MPQFYSSTFTEWTGLSIFVTTVLMPLYTTGLIKKIQWKNKLQDKLSIPQPVMMLVVAVLAFVLAAVLKLGLLQLFPNL